MPNPAELVAELRNSFRSGKTRPLSFRITQLRNLLRMYSEKKDEIVRALHDDLRKCPAEAIVMEIDFLVNDLKNTLWNLDQWARPEYVEKDLANLLDTAYVQREPYGVVLVIGAWNYPIQLTLLPFHGALAAGNCVLIKPSEVSAASAKLIEEIIPQYVDNDCYKVMNGGIPETTDLLKQRFDYIFYTGNTAVGKIVHAAANRHLTPVTLELGGKSPCYIDSSADIKTATKRIIWGKMTNMGQTCVAPDYLLCTKEVEKKFLETATLILREFYGPDLKRSPDLGRIVNDRHFERLQGLLEGGTVALGGDTDAHDRFMGLTVLTDVKSDAAVLQQEIFGPILPVVNVADVKEAIDYLQEREKPLALYVFSNRKADVELLLKNTSSGSVCVNDVIMQLVVDTLPFGGVGNSGMGGYHGKFSLDTFSHKKAILYKDLGLVGEVLGAAKYPPLTNGKIAYLRFMLAKRPPFLMRLVKGVLGGLGPFLGGVLALYLWQKYTQI
ncbi:unnamed protein product [Ceutorhynchus assimilis]|uniref:Aldehyde dehydrogenase n=1 Tax=Ceutorhynchus assimilis TaxID=467358 RepID=A0A9N9MHK8_9CUCU|nr:unnamed protein product [Ceutorhynchus assimilis]